MDWGVNPLTSFDAIDKIISNKESTIEDVLKCEQIRAAFKRQHPALIMYLISNLSQLSEIALGIKEVETPDIQSAALFCLCNDAPVFTNQITTNRTFLTKLSDYLKIPNPKYNNLVAYYRIFKNCLEKSSGFMFINFPDKQTFINNAIQMIDVLPVYLLIKDMATNCYPSVNQFLDNCRAPNIFLNSTTAPTDLDPSNPSPEIEKIERHNQIILEILSDFVKTAPTLAKTMVANEFLDKVITFLLNASNSTSLRASQLLYNLLILQDDVKLSSKPFVDAGNHIFERLSDLCNYVVVGDSYTSSKSSTARLITYLISKHHGVPDEVLHLCQTMFSNIFKYPVQSFLHNDTVRLFNKICNHSNIIESTDIQKVIIDQITSNYRQINANYFGQLFKLVDVINNSPKMIKSEEWTQFTEKYYKPWSETIRREYGGPLPKVQQYSYSSSSYEYEYEEEEEAEEDSDNEEEEEIDRSSSDSDNEETDQPKSTDKQQTKSKSKESNKESSD